MNKRQTISELLKWKPRALPWLTTMPALICLLFLALGESGAAAQTVATPTYSPSGGTYTGAQTVTISDSTSGATIYYTTNGTTPNTSSTKYTAPFSVATSQTVEAIGVLAGSTNSAVGTAGYSIIGGTPTAATPTFSPAAGTYTGTQSVTISDSTSGSSIYYTTNGTTPTTSSTKYTAAISVTASETIEAIATASGYNNSSVASAAYTINSSTPTAATPTFSPAAGSYASAQSVTISDSTSGSTIYYTTNGTTPTTSSTKYTAAISVTASETIEAIATASGYNNSAVGSAAYTITSTQTAATPTYSPSGGTYTGTQTVTISDTTSGATIYYTTNGTTPSTSSTQYTGPISVATSETVEAIATASGYNTSAVGTAGYTINAGTPTAATPTFSPAAGSYSSAQSVTISDTTSGATIYYTTNGTTPTTSSTKYTGAISVTASETIEAIATATGYNNSAVGSAAYTITSTPTAATPTFSPAAGNYSSAQSVSISDTTSGSTIYYTTNGTTPTTSSTKYTGAISVTASETIEAIATATGYNNSAVGSAAYTITSTPTAATPTFSPAAGSYSSAQSVTISDSTSGATIYYTTNGTTPTTSSTQYTGAITVSSSETIEAIATASGYNNSAVGSAAYTITTSSAPGTPTGLAATAGNTQVALTWTTSSGATSYNVYRGTTAGGESTTAIATGVTLTSYTNTGLTNGTTYYYKVAAVNASGTSSMSTEASATPTATTSGFSNEQAWDDGTTFYYQANFTGSWSHYEALIDTDNNAATGFTIDGIGADYVLQDTAVMKSTGNGSTWSFGSSLGTVTLTVGSGTVKFAVPLSLIGSPASAKVAFQVLDANWVATVDPHVVNYSSSSSTPPSVPTNLTAAPGNGQVGLTWTTGAGASSYNIYRGTTAGGEGTTPIATGVTTTSFVNTGLTNGTTYYYKVASVNASGTSAMSNEASASPNATVSFYVSPSGSDSNAGTISAPWLTVQHAANVVGPGATVYLRAGTYQQFDVNVSGSAAGGFITFTNYPGENALIDGTGWTPTFEHGLVHIQNHSYIKIVGLEIANANVNVNNDVPNGVYVRCTAGPMSNVQVLNCHIHNIVIQGAYSGGPRNAHGISVEGNDGTNGMTYVTVSGCELNGMVTGMSETMTFKGNVQYITCTNNYVHDNNNIGIDFIGGWGVSNVAATDQARNATCTGNTVVNCSTLNNPAYNVYSSAGLYVDGGSQILMDHNVSANNDLGLQASSERTGWFTSYVTASNNLIYNSNHQGIGIGGYNGTLTGGTQNCSFVNNTLYNNDTAQNHYGEFLMDFYQTNNVVENNIMYANSQNLFVNYQSTDSSNPGTFDYNVYYSTAGAASSNWAWITGIAHVGFAQWQSATGQDAHSVFANPLFTVAGSNFNLSAGSPALNIGNYSLGSTYYGSLDFAGNPRTKGSTIDVGAYEN